MFKDDKQFFYNVLTRVLQTHLDIMRPTPAIHSWKCAASLGGESEKFSDWYLNGVQCT